MPSLLERLQATLGTSYRLDRELGGGGMSKVFLAEEVALNRRVVIKVLSTEIAAEISADRFRREILLAARLQHPHIVPVLTAGELDGVPFFTMPFVEGESLRARLAITGPMAVTEAVPILRDVLRALDYAHGAGVVHRDIKPDNVLLAGNSATVADFGIAKALTAARVDAGSSATLTSVGMSVGTPAYIAPEQAAGDANVDHRADLYSFGCMAFELLAGEPPFNERTPQKLLVAHMSQAPRQVTSLRPDLPRELASLIARTLAKDPADRPQSAAELLKLLDASVSSGAMASAPVIATASRQSLTRGLLWWAASFVGVAVALRILTLTVGLPSWGFPLGIGLALLGLPAVILTSFVGHRTRMANTMGVATPGGTQTQFSTVTRLAVKASPFVSFRKTARAGVWVGGAFAASVAAWMLMWAFGIGSVGNLQASGKITANDPLLVADFASPASDTTLGIVVTEALRTDIAQSKVVVPVSATRLREILGRMRRPVSTRIDFGVAREIASREGIKAVLSGDVLAAGAGFVLSARLVQAETGDELAAFRETAKGPDDVIGAIDRLSKSIREKLGESLSDVRAASPMNRVTTSSLTALKRYTEGARLIDRDGDQLRGIPLLEEAIAADTTFGMAYRKVAITLRNLNLDRSKQRRYFERAYAYREGMSDLERLATEDNYYTSRWHYDRTKAEEVAVALAAAGNALSGYNNLGVLYREARQWEKSLEAFRRAIAADSTITFPYGNQFVPLAALRDSTGVRALLELMARRLPPSPGRLVSYRASALVALGNLDQAALVSDSVARLEDVPTTTRRGALRVGSSNFLRHGQLTRASSERAKADAITLALKDRSGLVGSRANAAITQAWLLDEPQRARQELEAAVRSAAFDSLEIDDRPYLLLSRAFAQAGDVARAKEMLKRFDAHIPVAAEPTDVRDRQLAVGSIAYAEKRYTDAQTAFRAADVGLCLTCALPFLARAYDVAGRADSAVAIYERYLGMADYQRLGTDALQQGPALKRLGELYDERGNVPKALEHYRAFVELWKNADAPLQGAVAQIRRRIAELERTRG